MPAPRLMRVLAPTLTAVVVLPLLGAGPAASDPGDGSRTAAVADRSARAGGTAPLRIRVESNRADLVSGGNALVTVVIPQGVRPRQVRVTVRGQDVTGRFQVRPNGRFQGMVTNLRVGRNRLVARAGERVGRQVIVNHPNGGPLFAGPQHGPYRCQPTAGVRLPLPVHRSHQARPAALRPGQPAGRRGHHDHRRGRRGPLRRTP
jgi:hypothetical protein